MNTPESTSSLPPVLPEWRVTRRVRRGNGDIFVPKAEAVQTPAAWVRGLLNTGTAFVPVEERQGHYVNAATAQEAAKKVAAKFPGEEDFDVQPWKDADRRPIENRKPRYVCVSRDLTTLGGGVR